MLRYRPLVAQQNAKINCFVPSILPTIVRVMCYCDTDGSPLRVTLLSQHVLDPYVVSYHGTGQRACFVIYRQKPVTVRARSLINVGVVYNVVPVKQSRQPILRKVCCDVSGIPFFLPHTFRSPAVFVI